MAGSSPDRLVVGITIQEGPRAIVSARRVEGAEHADPKDLDKLFLVVPGEPFNPNEVRQDVARLQTHYRDRGWRESAVGADWTLSAGRDGRRRRLQGRGRAPVLLRQDDRAREHEDEDRPDHAARHVGRGRAALGVRAAPHAAQPLAGRGLPARRHRAAAARVREPHPQRRSRGGGGTLPLAALRLRLPVRARRPREPARPLPHARVFAQQPFRDDAAASGPRSRPRCPGAGAFRSPTGSLSFSGRTSRSSALLFASREPIQEVEIERLRVRHGGLPALRPQPAHRSCVTSTQWIEPTNPEDLSDIERRVSAVRPAHRAVHHRARTRSTTAATT